MVVVVVVGSSVVVVVVEFVVVNSSVLVVLVVEAVGAFEVGAAETAAKMAGRAKSKNVEGRIVAVMI